jgi:hypothetical protein
MKQLGKARESIFPAAALFVLLLASGSVRAEGRLNCSPTVDLETEPCGLSGQIQTYARVTNKCACDVSVTVKLPGNGATIFDGVKRNGGTQHAMIMTCGPTKGQYTEFTYEFSCPEPSNNGGSKPQRDLSKQLQSAANDAANADVKNRQDLSALSQQHQQSVDAAVAKYKVSIRNWCVAHAQNCSAQCTSRARGSVPYMSACVNLCSAVVDACLAENLEDDDKRAQAEGRIRAANANIKNVVDQLNRQLQEQRAREEMEEALQVQAFLSALSGMASSSYAAPYRPSQNPVPSPRTSQPSAPQHPTATYNPPAPTSSPPPPAPTSSPPPKNCYTSKTELKYGYQQECY